MRSLPLALLLAAPLAFAQQQQPMPPAPQIPGLPPAALTAMQAISANNLAAHTRFLADDLFEGRGPGTRGGQLANKYMATQFALLGLLPAGDPGPDHQPTYFQRVPMVNVSARPESTFTLTSGKESHTLTGSKDYTATSQTAAPTVDIAHAPIVFVGYGIHAPELHWDDYAGIDVKGKVVLIFVNQPPSPEPSATGEPKTPFTGKALTWYGRWIYKYEEAARQGAVGAILIHQTQMAAYPWTVISTRWGRKTSYLRDASTPRLPLAAWIHLDVATRLFAENHLDLGTLMQQARTPGFKAIPLATTLTAHLVSTIEPFDGNNIVARLPEPGARPASPDNQAIFYTAHFDHLGMDPTLKGDQIFNGAIDNATGDAMLLEVARAFTQAPPPPPPLYFAAVDAEEQGLLGSEYLVEHPPIPLKSIALDLNFEGLYIMPAGIPQQLLVTGAERTSFLPTVDSTAKAFHMQIIPDPVPSAGFYFRSDHFSFARAGVPAFSIGAGDKFEGHDLAFGQHIAADFIAHRYHQVADEYSPSMDLRANARLAELAIALGWQAALSPTPIAWNPGDQFAAARNRP
jgi:Zn-dependent M28 family amino/carboxypeptidase